MPLSNAALEKEKERNFKYSYRNFKKDRGWERERKEERERGIERKRKERREWEREKENAG